MELPINDRFRNLHLSVKRVQFGGGSHIKSSRGFSPVGARRGCAITSSGTRNLKPASGTSTGLKKI